MLTKLVFKILFKATLPVVAIAGLVSYGMYSRGGDPAGMFSQLVGNGIQSAKSSIQGAGDALPSLGAGNGSGSKTTVYKWVDEYGVTHFGSRAPNDVAATAKTYSNKVNSSGSAPTHQAAQEKVPTSSQSVPGLDGEKLPGMAGANLPVAIDPAVLSEFLQTMQKPRQ